MSTETKLVLAQARKNAKGGRHWYICRGVTLIALVKDSKIAWYLAVGRLGYPTEISRRMAKLLLYGMLLCPFPQGVDGLPLNPNHYGIIDVDSMGNTVIGSPVLFIETEEAQAYKHLAYRNNLDEVTLYWHCAKCGRRIERKIPYAAWIANKRSSLESVCPHCG